jgi:hypothetical protein
MRVFDTYISPSGNVYLCNVASDGALIIVCGYNSTSSRLDAGVLARPCELKLTHVVGLPGNHVATVDRFGVHFFAENLEVVRSISVENAGGLTVSANGTVVTMQFKPHQASFVLVDPETKIAKKVLMQRFHQYFDSYTCLPLTNYTIAAGVYRPKNGVPRETVIVVDRGTTT